MAHKIASSKGRSVNSVKHELHTPLLILKLFTKQLQTESIHQEDKKVATYIHRLQTEVTKLNDFMILHASTIDEMQFQKRLFAFDELVEEVANEVQKTHMTHKIVIASLDHQQIKADRYLLGQAFVHLLSNAVKYSPLATSIAINVASDRQAITCSIENFGRDKDFIWQKKVYEHFFGLSERRGDIYPSFGEGLYIAASVINKQGGKLWIKNEKGKNVCYFTLPLA